MATRPRVKNLYYLKLIEPNSRNKNAQAFKQKGVQQWLQELPTINTGMVTRQLHDKLKQINETIIDFQDRFETLESLQPVYLNVDEFLNSKVCGQTLPLSQNVQKIVALHIEIIKEYANSYWYLLKTGPEHLGKRAYSKILPILIQRIIRLLSDILKAYYLANLAEPTWIWMDIHSLFSIMPDKLCENTKIKEFSLAGESITTISNTYKQIIALSTSDPYGMYDREIIRINHFLSQWVSTIKLEKIAPGQIPLGYFVSMDTDKAPSWANIDIDLDEESEIYQIFMDDIIKMMLDQAKVMESNLGRYFAATAFPATDNSFDPELLKHIQRQWEGEPVRQPVTFDSSLRREIAIGLNAISDALLNPGNQQPGSVFHAEVAGGKSLKCSLESGNNIAIGSLVGYRKADSEVHTFGLGIISRMSTPNAESDTQFELKNITNSIQAATIELVAEEDKKTKSKQAIADDPENSKTVALTFQKSKNGYERQYLIVESRGFKTSDTIVVNDKDRSFGAVVMKHNNLGLGYVVLEYQSITEVKQIEAIPTTGYDFL